jgi:hypothetical protein
MYVSPVLNPTHVQRHTKKIMHKSVQYVYTQCTLRRTEEENPRSSNMVWGLIQNVRQALKYRGGWKGLYENMYTVSKLKEWAQ